MPTLELNGKPFAEQTGTGEPVLKGNLNFEGPIRINNQEVLSANGSIRLTVDEISEKTQGGGITLSHSLKNSSGAEIINSSGSIGSAVDFTNIANNAISGDKIYGGTISTSAAVFEGSSANAIVRITQTGSGNALVVEDSANPDSTPFVVDSTGRVIVGHTSNVVAPGASSPALQLHGLNVALSTTAITNWANNAFSTPILSLNKSKSGVIETLGSVSSGDWLGVLQFTGDDGTSFISAASIVAQLDGTPGTNDMPGRLVFSTTADGSSSPTEAMRIDSNQSVQIKNNSSSDALRITQTGSGNALVVEDSANPDSTPFVVSSNGNVGIGKEPTTKLEIYNAGYAAAQITGDSTSETQLVFDDNTAARINNRSNTPLIFATNATERMRIDSSGNVGLTGGGTLSFYSGASVVGSIVPSSIGTTYNTTSDFRLKDNIQPISDGTEKLMAMNPVSHTWKADPEAPSVHGFIAQEMVNIIPESVSGTPDGEEMMTMDYGRITPVLVAALQDAHKKIALLETRLNTLGGN